MRLIVRLLTSFQRNTNHKISVFFVALWIVREKQLTSSTDLLRRSKNTSMGVLLYVFSRQYFP
ncbi:Uncharacterized protein APZ42_004199 [Daphnia magna]|uniref:Uncharacterized protein n=1 Tax=Daphnia magna TaxID=35525 RepID=A0A0P5YIL2_9CRUS|nr:Uncharacterized protein APZ42_004199 [Daphnia magna]